jgi:hypothetical protein
MKQASRLLSLLVLTVALVVLTGSACQKSTPERAWAPGAYHPVTANLKTPPSLPAGVSVGTISGYDGDCASSNQPLYMLVSNSKSNDIDVTFPAGLVFGASDTNYEYMILPQEYTFTVAASANQDTVVLSTYGCNENSLDAPDADASYSIAGVESDKDTQVLLDLLAGKSLVTGDNVDLVEEAMTEVFEDSTGLQDSTKTQLGNLP